MYLTHPQKPGRYNDFKGAKNYPMNEYGDTDYMMYA